MSIWRIRLTLSDDPRSLALFHEALADQPVSVVNLAPRVSGTAEMTGEIVVELAHDEGLGTMLGALHTISPQVFITRMDTTAAPLAANAQSAAPRPLPTPAAATATALPWRVATGLGFSRSALGR